MGGGDIGRVEKIERCDIIHAIKGTSRPAITPFKLNNQETLPAYELSPDKQAPEAVALLGVGPHENFYAQLKR
ncbi:MAG: type II toxin-antitoxin system RelE/ParE family toxin [Rhodoferax sp.]|uniref:type II toxin-antitoxin system RelE/ParE family toxin n=1 Tax=Rhodoferax sp. TaxID=50421 RepID=UPI003BB04AE9